MERLGSRSNYDKSPTIKVPDMVASAWEGWNEILARIRGDISKGARILAIECYPGVFEKDLLNVLVRSLSPDRFICMSECWKKVAEIDSMIARDLTDDPVFGRMNGFKIADFADHSRVAQAQAILGETEGVALLLGTGTHLISPEPDLLIYADMPRREIQIRQRAGTIGNLAANNCNAPPSLKYKRAFFLDWRMADRIKRTLMPKIDYLIDTNDMNMPKMVSGKAFHAALQHVVSRPFRMVPFFDPGPWGGQWMRHICDLPDGIPNYAWCFDCVPEENSLLLDFNGLRMEVPAINLVFERPCELLGDSVHGRFGAEFPIRFDLLDTMDGGNLSLQVHPLTEYIYNNFGIAYTQDESYYLLDATPDSCVYLGLKRNVDRETMLGELRCAHDGGRAFEPDRYVNRWPARKHDHFLIPAGTIHCSGANSMVLEISATPYIFTFKLWDWERPGLDGCPRPVHFEHGAANIQWDRDTEWVSRNLVNHIKTIANGSGWVEERTGLHKREFIETRRHWFESPVQHDASSGVHVLNLVEGCEAVIESPEGAFDPFIVHYAETFVVPACAGRYTVKPAEGAGRCATIRASVRSNA